MFQKNFVQFFLETIDKASNLDPTPRDCARLFGDIAVNLRVDSSAKIDLDKLLQSTLTSFLSYLQILQLIKYLKHLAKQSTENKNETNTGDYNLMGKETIIEFIHKTCSKLLRGLKRQ